MSKDSPSPPPAPDPSATASAQSQSNIATAIANAQLNRVNQTTPWGSITYTSTPGANGVPNWASQIQLSPEQQALLDQQQQTQLGRGALAQQYLGMVNPQPLNFANLAPINMRGTLYNGAVNAPGQVQAAPQGAPQAMPQATPQGSNSIAQAVQAAIAAAIAHQQQSGGGPTPAPAPPPAGTATTQPAQSTPASPLPSVPTYQDYLAANPQNNGGSEGGQGSFSGLSEDQWNALPTAAKWQNVGSGLAFAPNDPRYAAMASQLQGSNFAQGDTIREAYAPQSNPLTSTFYNDPTQVAQSGGVYATGQHNLTPYSQMGNNGGMSDLEWAMAVASLFGGGMAAGAAAGADSPLAGMVGSSAAPAGTAGDESAGLSMSNPFDTSAASSSALQGAPVLDNSVQAANPSIWSQMGNNLMSGKGILGLNPAARAGVGLLPTILRAMSSKGNGQGGGK